MVKRLNQNYLIYYKYKTMKTNLLKIGTLFTLLVFSSPLYPQVWGDLSKIKEKPYDPNPPKVQQIETEADTVYLEEYPLVIEAFSNYPIIKVSTKINNQEPKEWSNLFLRENAKKSREKVNSLLKKKGAYKTTKTHSQKPPLPFYENVVLNQQEILDLTLEPGINNIQFSITNSARKTTDTIFQVFYSDDTFRSLPILHLFTVGVGDYEQDDIPTLNYPAKDAEAIDSIFVNQESLFRDIKRYHLTDSMATYDNILAKIGELKDSVSNDDVIIAFFSGHGDKGYLSKTFTEEIRFMPYNFDHDRKNNTGIQLNIIKDDIEKLPCNSLIIFDTCHSGKLVSSGLVSRSSSSKKINDLVIQRNKENKRESVILTASATDAFEHAEWGHGALTKSILEVFEGRIDEKFIPDYKKELLNMSEKGKLEGSPQNLKGIIKDSFVDAKELIGYVKHRVPELVKMIDEQESQMPDSEGESRFFIYQLQDK